MVAVVAELMACLIDAGYNCCDSLWVWFAWSFWIAFLVALLVVSFNCLSRFVWWVWLGCFLVCLFRVVVV